MARSRFPLPLERQSRTSRETVSIVVPACVYPAGNSRYTASALLVVFVPVEHRLPHPFQNPVNTAAEILHWQQQGSLVVLVLDLLRDSAEQRPGVPEGLNTVFHQSVRCRALIIWR